MLNTTSQYPSAEKIATLPKVWQFVFTPPTAEDRTKEKIRRALELRNSFFAKYRDSGPGPYGDTMVYFLAHCRADRLWKDLQHQL